MNVVIAAGGTGGHLYPAVALASEFRRRDEKGSIVFFGTGRELERRVLDREGFTLECIPAQGVVGQAWWKAARALCMVPLGIWHALHLLRKWRAALVIGIGGFAAPPVVVAAWLLRIPRVLLEPNAYPGLANRLLGPLATRVFLSFEAAAAFFAPSKVLVTGTPIRRAFFEGGTPPMTEMSPTVVVIGGSQGALALNTAMIAAIPEFTRGPVSVHVIHQTGEADLERVREAYAQAGFPADVKPFLFNLPEVLRRADLVVSRAGAMTIAELTTCGKPAILVPLPSAAHRHQDANAAVMAEAGAARVIPQGDLTGSRLGREIAELLKDPTRLQAMATRSAALAPSNATERIVDACHALAGSIGTTPR